jgi:hypothetical protein
MGGRRILESPHLALSGGADAVPLLYEQHAVEKIGHDVDAIEGAHVARRVNGAGENRECSGRCDKSWGLDMRHLVRSVVERRTNQNEIMARHASQPI